MNDNVFIIDGVRTPIGSSFKSLKNFTAVQLGAIVIREVLRRNKIKEKCVDRVIFGNTVSAGIGQNLARQAAILANLPSSVPGLTINNVCGSGLQAVILASQAIRLSEADLIVAGGAESASRCPFFISKENKDRKEEDFKDSLVHDGLWCNITDKHMGELAEEVAKKFNVSREEQDQFAYESHMKANQAKDKNKFSKEIIGVQLDGGRIFADDERVRKNISKERLKNLPCAFKENGTLTAGNSSAPADGAAAVLIASQRFIEENKIGPKARILGYSSIAIDPNEVFESSVDSTQDCLKKCRLKIGDIDLFEIDEAFSSQAILTKKKLGIPDGKLNIYGGDVALGHSLGAADTRILVTLIHALINEKKKRGIASVCLGGGGSVAMAIEKVI